MKMKNIFQKIKLVSIALLLCSCNGGCDFFMDKEIHRQIGILNNTNDTIIFYFLEKFHQDMIDTVVLTPYSESFLLDESVTYSKPESRPCSPYLITLIEKNLIIIVTASGRTLSKDITNRNNWYCAENTRELWKVVFEINEGDLE